MSYALCLAELSEQMSDLGLRPSCIYASAAGATGAGLALGRAVLGLTERRAPNLVQIRRALERVREDAWPKSPAARQRLLLDLPHRLTVRDIEASEDYVGDAYGQVTPQGWEAIHLLAQSEGILLDPAYTSKAMAALIHDVRQKRIAPGEIAVFVHTGGTPAVFAYRDELMAFARK